MAPQPASPVAAHRTAKPRRSEAIAVPAPLPSAIQMAPESFILDLNPEKYQFVPDLASGSVWRSLSLRLLGAMLRAASDVI